MLFAVKQFYRLPPRRQFQTPPFFRPPSSSTFPPPSEILLIYAIDLLSSPTESPVAFPAPPSAAKGLASSAVEGFFDITEPGIRPDPPPRRRPQMPRAVSCLHPALS